MNRLSQETKHILNYDGIVLPPNIRREIQIPEVVKVYRVGIYLRLSRDDGKYKILSSSIETQKDICDKYTNDYHLVVHDYYIDDGWSGTNFDRPDWKRVIADFEAGEINVIVSKDMSRIGRDAIGVGNFYNDYCVERGLRLVAVSDGIDTTVDGTEEIMDFINMYNGWYPKDISKKTRNAKAARAQNGWYMGSNPPYGYRKSPQDYHILILSEDAPIVLEIYVRFNCGETLRQICDDFNARGVITPSQRIKADNPNRSDHGVSPVWTTTTMTNILNKMVYIGHMVQGTRRNVSHKSKKRKPVPANEHIVVLNTHEPIIPISLWDSVQAKRKGRNTPRKTSSTPGLNLFSGFVKCSDCKGVLAATKKKNKNEEYDLLRCARYNNGGKNACTSHTIRFDALYAIVLDNIRYYTTLATENEKALADRLYQTMLHEEESVVKSKAKKLTSNKQKLDTVRLKIERLYDEKFEKGMDEDIFNTMHVRYAEEKVALENEVVILEAELGKTRSTEESIGFWMDAIKNALDIDSLTRENLSALIDHIVVYEREKVDGETRQRVEIFYKFVGNLSDVSEQTGSATIPRLAV